MAIRESTKKGQPMSNTEYREELMLTYQRRLRSRTRYILLNAIVLFVAIALALVAVDAGRGRLGQYAHWSGWGFVPLLAVLSLLSGWMNYILLRKRAARIGATTTAS